MSCILTLLANSPDDLMGVRGVYSAKTRAPLPHHCFSQRPAVLIDSLWPRQYLTVSPCLTLHKITVYGTLSWGCYSYCQASLFTRLPIYSTGTSTSRTLPRRMRHSSGKCSPLSSFWLQFYFVSSPTKASPQVGETYHRDPKASPCSGTYFKSGPCLGSVSRNGKRSSVRPYILLGLIGQTHSILTFF